MTQAMLRIRLHVRSPFLGAGVQDSAEHASRTAQGDGKDYPTRRQHLPSQVPSCQVAALQRKGATSLQGTSAMQSGVRVAAHPLPLSHSVTH